jgi:hypothetical protein
LVYDPIKWFALGGALISGTLAALILVALVAG